MIDADPSVAGATEFKIYRICSAIDVLQIISFDM